MNTDQHTKLPAQRRPVKVAPVLGRASVAVRENVMGQASPGIVAARRVRNTGSVQNQQETMPSLNSIQDGARYDGWATWYDEYLNMPFYENIPAHLSRLVGSGSGLCVDIGCGTGVHLQLLESLGWSVIGVDLSADQLRLASDRSPRVVQANACRLPFSSATFRRVVSVLTLTDFDDVGPFFSEAHRVLDRHGRFVILGSHPCFLGPFATIERDTGIARIYPGYRETTRVFEGPGLGEGIRSKVGVRHVPLAELFNKLLAADLRLESVAELDGDTLPSLLAIVATKA